MMDFTALHHFYWVAREGNFTNASRSLKIAQPAISRAVMRLEEDLGGPLFIRHKRHVELTPLGNSVLLECQLIFDALERVRAMDGKGTRKLRGPLRIGAGGVIAEFLFPEALKSFMTKYPDVYPFVQTGAASDLLARIVSGALDMGVFFHVPEFDPSALELRRFASVPYRLVVAATAQKDTKVLSSFIGSREVDSSNTKRYPTLDKLRKKYPEASIRYSSNNLSFHKQLVMKGMGVAILPEFLVSAELKKGVFKDVLPRESFAFDLKVVLSKRHTLKDAASAFLESLGSTLKT